MQDKQILENTKEDEVQVRPYFARPNYGKFFEKNGVFDGKLFHARDKVTYTFVFNKEVISLHFDQNKKTIFYKGHNIANLELSPIQISHLEQFGKELIKKNDTKKFASSYAEILESYLRK